MLDRFRFSISLIAFILFPFNGYSQDKSEANIVFKGKTTAQWYSFYCAGCHGDNLEEFKNKEWIYGQRKRDKINSIKMGQEEFGMPSFANTFNDLEIEALAEYISHKSKENIIPPQIINGITTYKSDNFTYTIDTILTGLDVPWGMTFLPNGDLLITERSGKLYRYTTNHQLQSINGLPDIFVKGQGGLMDICLHPNFKTNGWLYFTVATPAKGTDEEGGNTALMRAKLKKNTLIKKEVLLKALPNSTKGQHFGSRIAFDNDGFLYLSVGERGISLNAQFKANHCGKIHRIYDDGRIPKDNPFIDSLGDIPSIWSYGHRNVQGLAIDPKTGELWAHEHGPKGGDELNLIKKGANYGWPEITFGINYDGSILSEDTIKLGMEQPVTYWIPSIAPCGMTFVTGTNYKGWENNIIIGSLRYQFIERVVIENQKVIKKEKLLENIGRVRNVIMGPDDYIYIAVEKPGAILRIRPIAK